MSQSPNPNAPVSEPNKVQPVGQQTEAEKKIAADKAKAEASAVKS